MNLINPIYSFVEFAPGSSPRFLVTEDGNFILTEDGEFILLEDSDVSLTPPASCDYPLPIVFATDLKFQVILQTAGIIESAGVTANNQKLYVVKDNAVITDEASLIANTILALSDYFTTTQIADNKVLLCWAFGLTGIEGLQEGRCFRLCLRADSGSTVNYFTSNCFAKISDTKYTSVIEYSSDENNYGFDYCNSCGLNRVRLHFYLGRPQIKEDQSVYIKSSGKRKLLKYASAELYELVTEFFTAELHYKITVALAHDIVNIVSSRYTGSIRKDGDYVIDWDAINDLKAPATAKVYAENYAVKNDNCNECSVYVVPVICATIQDIIATTESDCVELGLGYAPPLYLPDAIIDQPYNTSIPFEGTGPVTLEIHDKPSWMTIAIVDGEVVYSGTPTDLESDVAISVSISNDCSSLDLNDTINVIELHEEGTITYNYEIEAEGELIITADGVEILNITAPASGTLHVPAGALVNVLAVAGGGSSVHSVFTGDYAAEHDGGFSSTDEFIVADGDEIDINVSVS